MDRREFFGMGTSAAAAAAFKSTGIPLPDLTSTIDSREAAEVRTLLTGQLYPPPQPFDGVTASISAEFMEDYTAGNLWLGSAAMTEVSYFAQNGTRQIYSFQGRWNNVVPEVIERLYGDTDPALFPGQDTMTGWSRERKTIPEGKTPLAGVPRAYIVPAAPQSGKADRLVVYRDNAILSADLGADGSIGEIKTVYTRAGKLLSVDPLPAGTRYIFEGGLGGDCPTDNNGCHVMAGLRDLETMQWIFIDMPVTVAFKQVFPLSVDPAGGDYSCVVLATNGDVWELHLSFVTDRFRIRNQHTSYGGPVYLGNSKSGLIVALEPTPLHVQVFSLEFPYIWGTEGILAPEWVTTRRSFGDNLPDYDPQNFPSGSVIQAKGQINPDTGQAEVFLLVRRPDANPADPLLELWSTSRGRTGQWEPLMIVDKGVRTASLVTGAPDVSLIVSRPKTGVEFWVRDEEGDWEIDHIRLEAENGGYVESAGFRIGITLKHRGLPLADQPISLTASAAVTATIRGEHGSLGVHRPWKTTADATGTLWVTVLLEERLSFPSLIVSTPLFADRLVISLNDKVSGFLSGLSADQILSARDPRRCREDQTDGCSAGQLSQGLNPAPQKLVTDRAEAAKTASLIAGAAHAYAGGTPLRLSTSSNVRVECVLPWGWVDLNQNVAELQRLHPDTPGPSWVMVRRNGKAHFEPVSSEHAQREMARIESSLPAYEGGAFFGPFDFLTDVFDAIGDAAEAVYDGACQLYDAVADGLKIVLDVVIDGVHWVYRAVMDTIEMVMDAIGLMLEKIGLAVGAATGWLLDQLGFLFDWSAIKERRDFLRSYISKNLEPSLATLGSPRDGAASMKRSLATAKSSLYATLNTFRHTPSQEAFANSPGESSPFENFSFINNVSVLPQVTWMMDKLQAVLPDSSLGFDFDMPDGFDAKMQAFVDAVAGVNSTFVSLADSALQLFQEWILNGKLFTQEAFDPIVDLLMAFVGRIVDILNAVIDAGADLLEVLVGGAQKLLVSFDSSMGVPPFFKGFYKGLTGHDCSAVDLACLLAAIPSYAASSTAPANSADDTRRRTADAGQDHEPHIRNAAFHPSLHPSHPMAGSFAAAAGYDAARTTAICFGSISAVVVAVGTGATAAMGDTGNLAILSKICTVTNIVLVAGHSCANLADTEPWLATGAYGFLGIVGVLIVVGASFSPSVANSVRRGIRTLQSNASYLNALLGALGIFIGVGELAAGKKNSGVYDIMSGFQSYISHAVIETRKVRQMTEGEIALSALMQGALGGGKTAIYALRPIL